MTLTSLKPRWWGDGTRRLGLSFLCPHCKNVRLGVALANPPDGGPPQSLKWKHHDGVGSLLWHVHEAKTFDVPPGFLWTLTGTDFKTLSLSPSVDASKSGHWHGYVTNGQIV